MKRFRTIISVALLALVPAGIWLAGSHSEPVYLGHPITYWIEPWQHHNSEPAANIDAAFAEMDDRAVEWLIRELKWQPSSLVAFGNRLAGRFSIHFADRPDRRERAAMALGRLGPRAARAIPTLEANAGRSAAASFGRVIYPAQAALIQIRREPIQAQIDLVGPHHPLHDRLSALTLMAYLGKDASNAVPSLVDCLSPTNTSAIRLGALTALRSIGTRSEACLLPVTECLRSNDADLQVSALHTLKLFGASAEPAAPVVAKLTQSTNRMVSMTASNLLQNLSGPAEPKEPTRP
jgi:hypothetical protein